MRKTVSFFTKIIDWFKSHNIYDKRFYKSHGKVKRWLAIFFTSFVSMLTVLVISVVCIGGHFLGLIDRANIDHSKLGVNSDADKLYSDLGVTNIILYGIDSRTMAEQSRSDAIMMLTVDTVNKKIKMTSIARDTYVDIQGYGKDKINHAFAYGWAKNNKIAEGAELSIKTINSNFNLNIKDYVAVNFWALADIINYIGGVEIDVDAAEMRDINKNYIPHIRQLGIPCEDITATGVQTLSGGQAVAYCRERYVGGVVSRDSRQREVLTAMFDKAKSISPTKYTGLLSLILKECSTSLTNNELWKLGSWAIANMNVLKFENLGLPTSDIDKGGSMINGVWYYTYDLDKAAKKIQEFITEKPAN